MVKPVICCTAITYIYTSLFQRILIYSLDKKFLKLQKNGKDDISDIKLSWINM